MNLRVAALVDNMNMPGLRRVFIPPFHHPNSRLGPNDVIPPTWPYGGLDTRRLYTAPQRRFVLGAPPNVKGVFQQQGSRSCFSIAACIWHCYSTPPTHSAHRTPDRYTTG